MKSLYFLPLLFFYVAVPLCEAVEVQTPTLPSTDGVTPIVHIEISGASQFPKSTYQYYIQTHEGDLYDSEICRQDFQRLWRSNLLRSLRVEIVPVEGGVTLRYIVEEKPVIDKIVWPEKIPHLKQNDIETKFSEAGLLLSDGQPYDDYTIYRARRLIEDLYAGKGFRFAVVTPKIEVVDEQKVRLIWNFDPGENLKVGDIVLDGNRAFNDKELQSVFKNHHESSLWSRIWGKDKYEPEKLKEDLNRLREFYFEKGYLDVRLGDPHVDVYTGRSFWNGKPVKRLRITVPVYEGPRYRIANIRFEGAKLFSEQQLLKMLYFKDGEWFNNKKVTQSVEWILDRYGEKGYIFANIIPDPVPVEDSTEPAVNLVFRMQEHFPQTIRRLEFTGNTFTYDSVIRREFEVQESDLLNAKLLRRSLKKVYRLGYFDNIEPEVKPVPDKDDMVDIVLKVSENRRNQIQAGGGYSELEGIFGTFAFSTRNLFGTGKSLGLSFQAGKRVQTYQISLADPYFLGRDLLFGVDIFNTWNNLFIYEQRNRGGTISIGFPVWRDLDFRIASSYSRIRVYNINENFRNSPNFAGFTGDINELSRTDVRLMPAFVYSTLSDPIDPTEGSYYSLRLEYAGEPLGGDVNVIKPSFQIAKFIPVNRKGHRFAFNLEGGVTYTHHGGDIPFYERYFLGGELTVRGYDFRTVGPIDPNVSRLYTIGGSKYGIFNLEYIVPIKQSPAQLVFFWDGGNAFSQNEKFSLSDFRFSSGLEFRIIIPALQTPMRLIFSRNWNRGPVRADAWAFRFGVGRTF